MSSKDFIDVGDAKCIVCGKRSGFVLICAINRHQHPVHKTCVKHKLDMKCTVTGCGKSIDMMMNASKFESFSPVNIQKAKRAFKSSQTMTRNGLIDKEVYEQLRARSIDNKWAVVDKHGKFTIVDNKAYTKAHKEITAEVTQQYMPNGQKVLAPNVVSNQVASVESAISSDVSASHKSDSVVSVISSDMSTSHKSDSE